MQCLANEWCALGARSVCNNEWRAPFTAVNTLNVVVHVTSRSACSSGETRVDSGLRGS